MLKSGPIRRAWIALSFKCMSNYTGKTFIDYTQNMGDPLGFKRMGCRMA